jgi:hypothetical protein
MNPECPAFLLRVCVRILCQSAVDISAAALCLSDLRRLVDEWLGHSRGGQLRTRSPLDVRKPLTSERTLHDELPPAARRVLFFGHLVHLDKGDAS